MNSFPLSIPLRNMDLSLYWCLTVSPLAMQMTQNLDAEPDATCVQLVFPNSERAKVVQMDIEAQVDSDNGIH